MLVHLWNRNRFKDNKIRKALKQNYICLATQVRMKRIRLSCLKLLVDTVAQIIIQAIISIGSRDLGRTITTQYFQESKMEIETNPE